MHPGAIDDLAAAVCADRTISEQQLRALLDLPAGGDAQHALQAAAVRIRRHFRGDRLSFCSILNAKGGRCSEDCRYCGQARGVEAAVTDWLEDAQIRAAAADCAATGAWALSLVAAWRGLRAPARVAMVCRSIAAVADSGIRADASLGLIEADGIAEELRAAGLRVYHHNLETARSHFPHTCSTHGWADRLATIERVQGAGLALCCGGIIGLGESVAQRAEFARQLAWVGPRSVPINFIDPLPGSAAAALPRVQPDRALITLAAFRFALPRSAIVVAGGKEATFGARLHEVLGVGVDGVMVGNYLTSCGTPASYWRDQAPRYGLRVA